jgi:hypothetical protein
MKFKVALFIFMVVTLNQAIAHTMTPGYQKKNTISDVTEMRYEIGNHFKFPAVYELSVLTKEGKKAKYWKAISTIKKLKPNAKKSFVIFFKSKESRKLLVCTSLKEVGYESKPAQVISRVCSRLFINRIS